MRSYTKSLELLARLRKVTPGGSQTLSKRAERFPEGAFPVVLKSGCGPYVYDVDGNRYLDMICGLASMTLGYSEIIGTSGSLFGDKVKNAVVEQVENYGHAFSLANELEAEVAEKICNMIPCAEMVRFVKSGSEATEAAIRVARKATGRPIIMTVRSGYHSWHSWFQAIKPEHPGIPKGYEQMVVAFDYNEDLTPWVKQKCLGDIAAIILEPCLNEKPDDGWLQHVRDVATKSGALLIFDEMVTGFRWSNGGAQQYFGVTPDLATFGKACANGYPLAFLCGKREYMQHADVVSGTFGGDCVGLAACNAVLDIYKDQPIIDTLWARGRQFQDGVNLLIKDFGIPAICDGFPVKPRIRFTEKNVRVMKSCSGVPDPFQPHEVNNLLMSLFVQELAEQGVLWHPAGGNISAAMTERDIDFALSGVGGALAIAKRAIQSGDWSALRGQPIKPSQFVRGGA